MLVAVGVLSDRLRVRKPFMIAGGLISLIGSVLFAAAATKPGTSYHTFAIYFMLIAGGGGMAYVAWMAAFTESVERHNPAATATGLAIFGWIIRVTLMFTLALLPVIVPATTTLVDKAPRVKAIVERYPQQIKVLQTVKPVTLAALKRNPADKAAQADALSTLSGLAPAQLADPANAAKVQQAAAQLKSVAAVPPADLAYLAANAQKVAEAAKDGPSQWQTWWWICVAGQLVFIPFVFVISGRWSPRKAREDEAAHERRVRDELARLQVTDPALALTR
jgi:hypothetical protein